MKWSHVTGRSPRVRLLVLVALVLALGLLAVTEPRATADSGLQSITPCQGG